MAMLQRRVAIAGILVFGLATIACERQPTDSAVPARADRAAELQREREQEIARLNERVAKVDREYVEANEKLATGRRKASAGLREEVNEDVANVKEAVSALRTTTPENWWERHEKALDRTADDIEADVRRLAGKVPPAAKPAGTTGDNVSSAPFESRRDTFVADLRARVEGMEQALDRVKTRRGTHETEVEDTRARVKKLREDVDRLRSASPEDWWDLTKERVTEYLDRVEKSVKRLDDNKS
jgi:hypothetical protein